MWLSWLGIVPQSAMSSVQFPVKAQAWVAGPHPQTGPVQEATNQCFSPSLSPSLKINKIFFLKKRKTNTFLWKPGGTIRESYLTCFQTRGRVLSSPRVREEYSASHAGTNAKVCKAPQECFNGGRSIKIHHWEQEKANHCLGLSICNAYTW